MGLTVYLDSCLVIYIVEENLTFLPVVEHLASTIPNLSFVASPLTELECLVLPLRNKNHVLIDKFGLWFQNALGLDLNRQIFLEASKLRAENRSLKTPDAVHIAATRHYEIDEFWTNDDRLKNLDGVVAIRNILNS